MIRFCVYILLVALTLQSFYCSILAVDYQIHLPNYIAQCINTDKPELHCDGQCVLMGKTGEKEEGEATKNLVVYEYSGHYVIKEKNIVDIYPPDEEMLKGTFSPYLIDYRFTYHSSILRPPIA